MQPINERIKKVVDDSTLTRTAFGERLNVTQQYVSKLISKGNPSDRTIIDICREFGVNEEWLRTGEGEPYVTLNPDEEFDRVCAEIQLSDDEFIKKLMREYWKLTNEQKEIVKTALNSFFG